jgi:DNA-binding beta-propeller fold protein YncE
LLVNQRPLLAFFFCVLPLVASAQALDFNAVHSAEQLRRGVQAFHRGFYSDAIVSLEKAISYQSSNTLAQEWLGRTLWKSGFEQEAIRTWNPLVANGVGGALLRDWISVIDLRRGLGREIDTKQKWVVSSSLDGSLKGGYPFKRPTSVRSRPDGSFWVVAFGSNEVLKFNADFKLLEVVRGGLAGLDRPYDVAEATDGTLFISEYGANRIAKCTPAGDKITTFGGTGRADGRLVGPQYLALDGRGYLWVTDWGNSRVVRYDLDGNFIQSIPGIDGPTGVAVHDDRLYVSSRTAKQVFIFDLSGNPLGSLGDGVLTGPEGISFTADGMLMVADANGIRECDVEREVWTTLGDMSGHTKRLVQQSATPNGQVLGVDFDKSRVVLLTDTTSLYAGLFVHVDRINSAKFPEVYADVSVETRLGRPVVGLGVNNFVVTENNYSVGQTTMALASKDVKSTDVSLVIERSPDFEASLSDARQAVADLYDLVTRAGRIEAISAGDTPEKEADFGETRLRFIAQALQGKPSPQWKLGAAARLAGDDLLTSVTGARRAIVFFTTGAPNGAVYAPYSLTELAAYLRNNSIAFYPVVFGSRGPGDELEYLASESGGRTFDALAPGGMKDVVKEVGSRVVPTYTLRYTSPTPPRFGDAYIPFEVEVTVQKISGRDEAGYYAPPAP